MATSYLKQPIVTCNRNPVELSGRFFPQTGGAVVNASNVGNNFTVARTSQGLFTITLAKKYPKCISMHASLQLPSTGLLAYKAVASTYSASGGTFLVYVVDAAGSVQDVTANANASVSFSLQLSETASD